MPSMPTALSSSTLRSSSRRTPVGSSVRNAAAMLAFCALSLASAAAFLSFALGAFFLTGAAASSSARRRSRSAFLAASSAFLFASRSALDAPLAGVSRLHQRVERDPSTRARVYAPPCFHLSASAFSLALDASFAFLACR